jgi:uncharacterized membrane protein
VKVLDEADRKRIVEIAVAIVEGQVAKGEVDADDFEALKRATRQAVRDARGAYYAALEYLSG